MSNNAGGGTYQQGEAPPANEIPHDVRTWAMFCHLGGFAGFIPFGNIVVPLILWQLKRHEHEFIDRHGKESLNFQISVTIAAMVAFALAFFVIGVVLLPVIILYDAISMIVAALRAANGEPYQYPLTIRFVQ